jgi:hypothetical protein
MPSQLTAESDESADKVTVTGNPFAALGSDD